MKHLLKILRAWKRLYAEQKPGLNENLPWADILLELNLSRSESIELSKRAIAECDAFSVEDAQFLGRLPCFVDVVKNLTSKPNADIPDCYKIAFPYADDVYVVRYPKLADLQSNENLGQFVPVEVPIVVATIVCHRHVDFPDEIFVQAGLDYDEKISKHLIVCYADEPPKDFVQSAI